MIFNYVILVFMSLLSTFFIICVLNMGKYDAYIEPLDEKIFLLHSFYGIGFYILDLFKFNFKTSTAVKLRKDSVILYGENFSEYYLRVFYAQKISITYIVLLIVLCLSVVSGKDNQLLILAMGIILSVAIFLNLTSDSISQLKKRGQRLMVEFPNVVSTLALLVNAGMILKDAWTEVANSSEGEIYLQMRLVDEDMERGYSQIDALYAFAGRCYSAEIKKFTSIIVQGIEKGNSELAIALRNESDEFWHDKRQRVVQKGEMAANKLMIPIMIMFLGILLMIMGPIMTNLSL